MLHSKKERNNVYLSFSRFTIGFLTTAASTGDKMYYRRICELSAMLGDLSAERKGRPILYPC